MNHTSVRHILLDFGGVLFNINFDRMQARMAEMSPSGAGILYDKKSQHEAFTLLEIGKIEGTDFASQLKEAYGLTGSIQEIIDTWNYLLVGIYDGREALVGQLAKQYDLALLSNTNAVHFAHFAKESQGVFSQLQHLFLSYEMGMRKPNDDIYLTALEQMGWKASETLFVDDSIQNIEAAQSLGIQTFWVEQASDFERMVAEFTTEG